MRRAIAVGAAAVAAIGISAVAVPAAEASSAPSVVVVGKAGQANCSRPTTSSIPDAISRVAVGGTVRVCAGTYPGGIAVDKRITLSGLRGATIDAHGAPYGIGVSASWSQVSGFTVENADDPAGPGDGIVTAAFGATGPVVADHVTITGNTTTHNTGNGIDVNSSSYDMVRRNVSNENGVGINVADDLGAPAEHNTILGNQTNLNSGGCGIALADHSGLGVDGNTVSGNVADDNGLSTPTAPDASAGSGVILASPVPGGKVENNLIVANEFHGNGHGGVVMHSHVPGQQFSGNKIIANNIGTNNNRTDADDLETTGIYLGSATPVTLTVLGNYIHDNHYGIFLDGPVSVVTPVANAYVRVQQDVGRAGS